MKKPNITPGEWLHIYDVDNDQIDIFVQNDPEMSTIIAETTQPRHVHHDNDAKLISAAPNMMNVLVEIVKKHDEEWHILDGSLYCDAVDALMKAGVKFDNSK